MASIGTDIDKAAAVLESGGLVALPTETVYGLAANALDKAAVSGIYRVKQRPTSNPLILHLADREQLGRYVMEIPAAATALMERFWPGPLTLLLPRSASVPDIVTAGLPRVAVRIPDHPLTLDLLRRLPFPLVAPSANPFGYISPTTARHVAGQIGEKIGYILDGGPCTRGVESTIVGFEADGPVVYRLGAITLEELELAGGPMRVHTREAAQVQAPGMLPYHYAPHTPLYLTEEPAALAAHLNPERTGIIACSTPVAGIPAAQQVLLSATNDLQQAARALYGALHHLDSLGLDAIVAEKFADAGLGRTLNDRLQRAAARQQPGISIGFTPHKSSTKE